MKNLFPKVNTDALELLHQKLVVANIPHDYHDWFEGKRIAYPNNTEWKISCVQFYGSHGIEQGLIEALGLGCDTEPYSVNQLFKKIKKDFEKTIDK